MEARENSRGTCHAERSRGGRCRQAPVEGFPYCRTHLPQAYRDLAKRLKDRFLCGYRDAVAGHRRIRQFKDAGEVRHRDTCLYDRGFDLGEIHLRQALDLSGYVVAQQMR